MGEWIGDVLLLQVHLADTFEIHGDTYVRVLGWSEDNGREGEYGYKHRIAHVDAIKNGVKAYAIFDEVAGSRAFAGYCYELGGLYELRSGTYIQVIKRLTVEQFQAINVMVEEVEES
ncbi:hypothetical protein JCM19239_860 [Vibrio variabilis]|uniref:Phage protein n=1 Tax=Vibrio variabilis TaxID=990271 RepID=A0ABQ0JBP3_9VIBR|nr:hypothetical protein JCM19239_860 [Vibrio variabilis]